MREAYDDRFWAENHQLLSDGIARGFRRVGKMMMRGARWIGRLVGPDRSEEARKRTYCIG